MSRFPFQSVLAFLKIFPTYIFTLSFILLFFHHLFLSTYSFSFQSTPFWSTERFKNLTLHLFTFFFFSLSVCYFLLLSMVESLTYTSSWNCERIILYWKTKWFFRFLNIFVEKKGLCSDPDMLSCMEWTAMWCRTLFLLLSSPFHLVSFLDILVYRVGRVTSVL